MENRKTTKRKYTKRKVEGSADTTNATNVKTTVKGLSEEELIAQNIEKAIEESQNRTKLYIVYDEGLNKWKAIKEKGKRAIKMANTRTGLIKEIKPIAQKENFEIVVLKKRDMLTKYKELQEKHIEKQKESN